MTTKLKIFLGLAAVAFVFTLVGFTKDLMDEKARLQKIQDALEMECDTLRAANGSSIAKLQELNYTVSEFERYCDNLQEQVKELGIKNSRLQHLVQFGMTTRLHVDTIVRDSIVYVPSEGINDTLQCFNYHDPWVWLSGCINQRTGAVQADFASKDTLLVVAHRVPKKFWFIKWGTKKIELDIKSQNPHSSITHAKYIKFSKD